MTEVITSYRDPVKTHWNHLHRWIWFYRRYNTDTLISYKPPLPSPSKLCDTGWGVYCIMISFCFVCSRWLEHSQTVNKSKCNKKIHKLLLFFEMLKYHICFTYTLYSKTSGTVSILSHFLGCFFFSPPLPTSFQLSAVLELVNSFTFCTHPQHPNSWLFIQYLGTVFPIQALCMAGDTYIFEEKHTTDY